MKMEFQTLKNQNIKLNKEILGFKSKLNQFEIINEELTQSKQQIKVLTEDINGMKEYIEQL